MTLKNTESLAEPLPGDDAPFSCIMGAGLWPAVLFTKKDRKVRKKTADECRTRSAVRMSPR